MRGLDFIATAAAVGVFGYFVWKVILPKLGDLQLPVWQPPPPPLTQYATLPPQYQQPAATIPDQVPPAQPIEQDPEKPKSKQEEEEEEKPKASLVPSRSPPSAVVAATPPPPSQPTAAGGTVLWDSNTHGKWNSGTGKGLQKYGSSSPGGGGMITAASGNPSFDFDGNGVMHLTSSRWGRVYIFAKNYNSRLEGNFMFETDHGVADNISIKMRSRHGTTGHPSGGGNNFGGVGFAFHPDGEVELAAEITHGGSSYDFGSLKGPAFQLGKWHKFAISVYDGGGINVKVDVDGRTIGSKKWTNPHASAIDKAAFAADSYFWIRLNCHDGKGAKAAFSNLRLVDLGASSGLAMTRKLMIDEPYLFNGYYGRRRL